MKIPTPINPEERPFMTKLDLPKRTGPLITTQQEALYFMAYLKALGAVRRSGKVHYIFHQEEEFDDMTKWVNKKIRREQDRVRHHLDIWFRGATPADPEAFDVRAFANEVRA